MLDLDFNHKASDSLTLCSSPSASIRFKGKLIYCEYFSNRNLTLAFSANSLFSSFKNIVMSVPLASLARDLS